MAEEIQKKKISELPSAVYLSDADVMPVVQGSGSSEATKKVDIGLVGSTVAESKTFSNLDTSSKTLVGAINEVNSSIGNVPSADEISYDNTSSGLSASDVQGAIDEIAQGGSGGSTVTVTQIQSEGTKIATITVDSVDTDLYAPNGGGGASAFEDLTDVDIDSATLANGQVPVYNSSSAKWENGTIGGGSGHIILDDEGTSLTQRDDLQFKGVYSEDDSTNEKTVVNVARTMTLAEFEQLTDDEKVGFINVKDETSGSDDKFQPVIYSEDEREIGVWVDGKPLYEKTIINSSPSYTQVGSIYECNTSVDFSGVDYFMIVNATALNANSTRPINDTRTDITAMGYVSIGKSQNNIYTAFNTDGYTKLVFTLRYTKTTDTPGSGQWTPQGVPTVHYSENEQVVGTWIDGKPLYERVIDLGADTNISYDSWTLTTVSLSEIDRLVLIQGLNSTGAAYYGDLYGGNNNGYLQLLTGRNGTYVSVRYLIFRYTKSST